MMYDPNKPLSNEELESLPRDEFFEYLDSKAEYLKRFSTPLSGYKLKRFAYGSAAVSGEVISHSHHEQLGKWGKENFHKTCELVKNKLK